MIHDLLDRVEISGSFVGLETLRSAVTTRSFESLYSSWDTYFGKLAAFRERFGHCNVEAKWEEDVSLGRWVAAQRTRRTKGILTEEQIARLDELGSVWDWQIVKGDETWMKWLQELKIVKERFGHCNVSTYGEDASLARWVVSQRTRRKEGGLDESQIRNLDELGFAWDFQSQKAQETWMKWYRELEAYTKENGNPHVPRTHDNTKLASWVWIQRQRRKGTSTRNGIADLMTEEQIILLDNLGFRWDAREEKWTENFEKLKQFKKRHGHCEVCSVPEAPDRLVSWVRMQRSLKARGKLDAKRQAQVEELGFSWVRGKKEPSWDEMYDHLKNYYAQHGNADVPGRWKEDPRLARWVAHQRQRRKKRLITDEQVCLLDDLRFTWQYRKRGSWEDRLAEVADFKATHGHCEIPLNYPENPKLGRFVNQMRTQRNSGKLSDERIVKLDALGFVWMSSQRTEVGGEGINAAWKARFDELLCYKEMNGHCKVPTEWPENPVLGRWVGQQRQKKKSGTLHPKREELLNSIDFDWGFTRDLGGVSLNNLWELRYAQLVEFKNQNGHCNVPYNYTEHRQLGTWVGNQRTNYKAGKLSPERQRLLETLGFVWSAK